MPKLSVTIVAQDEEREIGDCIGSAAWADEVVVIDGGSRDRTIDVAEQAGARVIRQPWLGYAAQKNFALDRASHDWVFSLDADERITGALRDEIVRVLSGAPSCDGYAVPRRSYFLGRWMRFGGWYPDYNLRLFRRDKGRFKDRAVHECVEVAGRVGRLSSPIDHYTYRSLSDYVTRMDRYSTLAAGELIKEGTRPSVLAVLARPPATFARMYVAKAGFRDGARGMILAGCYAAYTFFKYAKAWEATKASRSDT